MTISPLSYTDEQLEAQYNLRALRPDYNDKVVPGWRARSQAYRQSSVCKLDVRYGKAERQTLDFFAAPDAGNRPTLVYFHGGYWQRGDKSDFSFIAESFNKHGVSVVFPNYTLCPAGSITNISAEAREALAWLYRNMGDLGGDRSRLYVAGHSAGGHITGMLMGTDWPAYASDLPVDLIKGGVPISPLMALEPLLPTSINENVGMDRAEAIAESPMNHPPTTDAPQLVVCGARETPEFHRQSDIYVEAFVTPRREIGRYSVPDSDHFDELDVLAREDSTFFKKVIHLIQAGERLAARGPSVALIDELVKAFNRHDVEAVLGFFAEDAQMYGAAGAEVHGTKVAGRAAIGEALARRFASTPDIQWTGARNCVSGNKALSEWLVSSTGADGKKVDVQGCDIYEFENGKIVKKDTYYKQVTK